MKKGINAWSFQKNSLAEMFDLAAKAGFEGVEVALDETGEVSLESTEKDLMKVAAEAKNAGISLYSVASGLYWNYSLTDPDPAKRAKAQDIVKKQLETAAALNCETILVIPGAVRVSFSPELGVVDYAVARERSLEAFDKLKAEAEATKVAIGLENVWNGFLTSPIELRDFIDTIGSPYVGSYFDVGNALYFGEPEQWIRILGSRIKKVHFKDYRRAVGSLDGFVDLLAGDVDYPEVMKAFKEVGYDGWASAEMIPGYQHYPDTLIYNTSNAMDAIFGR